MSCRWPPPSMRVRSGADAANRERAERASLYRAAHFVAADDHVLIERHRERLLDRHRPRGLVAIELAVGNIDLAGYRDGRAGQVRTAGFQGEIGLLGTHRGLHRDFPGSINRHRKLPCWPCVIEIGAQRASETPGKAFALSLLALISPS